MRFFVCLVAAFVASCGDSAVDVGQGHTGTMALSQGNEKISLCHLTGSATNPYVLISVSESAFAAHDGHNDFAPNSDGICEPPPPNELAAPMVLPTAEPASQCTLPPLDVSEAFDSLARWQQTSCTSAISVTNSLLTMSKPYGAKWSTSTCQYSLPVPLDDTCDDSFDVVARFHLSGTTGWGIVRIDDVPNNVSLRIQHDNGTNTSAVIKDMNGVVISFMERINPNPVPKNQFNHWRWRYANGIHVVSLSQDGINFVDWWRVSFPMKGPISRIMIRQQEGATVTFDQIRYGRT
jgi:hypothetical protein